LNDQPLKILVLVPVSVEIWNKVFEKSARAVVFSETEIVVKNIKEAPPAIETEFDVSKAAPYVVDEVIKANKEGFNAIIIACSDDPGLSAAREVSEALVLGIGETSLIIGALLGSKIAWISPSIASKPIKERIATLTGLQNRVVYISGLGIKVLDVLKNLDIIKQKLLEEATKAVNQYGVDVIVLGSGSLTGLGSEITEKLHVPVVDPVPTTVKVAESLVKLGLSHSKVHIFNRLKLGYM